MGHAIADEAARRGAQVTLVTSSVLPSAAAIERIQVESAQEMADAVEKIDPDVAVMAAAVADFRPATTHDSKLSRSDGPPEIVLEPTPDILAGMAARARRPYLVGFAAETGSLDRTVDKARRKGVDLLVANDVAEPGAGFAVDTNHVHIVRPDGRIESWPLLPKTEVAARLWDLMAAELVARAGGRTGGGTGLSADG
jgi:phosphopantothenoylcysteine decarboxylase/phosphopantothenate--cysteine ligase